MNLSPFSCDGCQIHTSRSMRKTTLWTMRNVSTQINLRIPSQEGLRYRVMITETENPQEAKSVCPSQPVRRA